MGHHSDPSDEIVNAVRQLPHASDSRVLVAFSGGLDSTVLLVALAKTLGSHHLVAAHVDHGLHEASPAWARHCTEVARGLGVDVVVERLTPPARFDDGLEAWARQERYAALQRLGAQRGARLLALGHHADDQAETVLLNLGRGAGLRGAAGMQKVSRRGETWLWRPFLALPRERLLAWARAHDLRWIEDPSNRDASLRRNALRHELLPALERAMPGFRANLLRHAQHCAEVDGLLAQKLGATRPGAKDFAGDKDFAGAKGFAGSQGVPLSRERLRGLPVPEQALRLRHWLAESGLRMPRASVLAEMRRQLIDSHSPYAEIRFDGRLLRRYRDEIQIVETSPALPRKAGKVTGDIAPVSWHWGGETRLDLPELACVLHIQKAGAAGGLSGRRLANDGVWIRTWLGTARLRLRAEGPARRLRVLCQEHGIAHWDRRRTPILVDAVGTAVFVPGLGIDAHWLSRDPDDQPLEISVETL